MTAHNPAMKAPEDFKPFEQVLLRDNDDQPWRKDLFDEYVPGAHHPFSGLIMKNGHGNTGWRQCIPFAGNEALEDRVELGGKRYIGKGQLYGA